MLQIEQIAEIAVLSPLIGSLVAGLLAKRIGCRGAHCVTIGLMLLSVVCAFYLFNAVVLQGQSFVGNLYTWGIAGFDFHVGFLLDSLTCCMLVTVTFVSLLVHIYSMGYMQDDSGYQRFFCYVSLFTFAMLMLVTANNFLQLFFGWEGVGLVSYLLIGFWFNKDSAASGSLKAFLVNRVGDFGFILGIAAILSAFGTLDYQTVFSQASTIASQTITLIPGHPWSLATVICILLFVGAMGKSAQVPLHVWLPESMEGPTPISALIHAATMVTAGIFMVARMSPLFEYSPVALSVVLVIGATGALFLGFLAFVEFDIKRVIAYSTMSQLGYMMAANGVSAYQAAIFHLMTHACFKALLFLAAGSIIVGVHHEQDMRKMGGLRKYMPITYICFLAGALALCAIPPFSGFYSKDAIIEAVHLSTMTGAGYAYVCLVLGSFVTGYYTFRAFFMTFHGKTRMDEKTISHIKEYPSMCIPLILLAIPSVILGFLIAKPMLYASVTWLNSSVTVFAGHDVLTRLAANFTNVWDYALHAPQSIPFWFAVLGIALSWFNVLIKPEFTLWLQRHFSWLHTVLIEKYGIDRFNDWVFVRGLRGLAQWLMIRGEGTVIDGGVVAGSGRLVIWMSRTARRLQTGYLFHYILVMLVGLLAFLVWMIF